MPNSANVRSIDALRNFRGALLRFQDEAHRALASLTIEGERELGWIQQDRPAYWKRQNEVAHHQLAEARSALMQCRMRRTGDFKPTCYDEQKAVSRAKARLELCYKKIQVVKQWSVKAAQEVDEYRSRTNTLVRFVNGDLPRAVAVLERMIIALEKYASMNTRELGDAYESANTDQETQSGEQQAEPDSTPTETTE